MWSTRNEQLAHGTVVSVDFEKRPVKFSEVLRRWQDDPVFRAFFIALLADAPFPTFRWETPPITTASAVRPFEFVLLDSPELASQPDPDAFAEHFGDPAGSKDVVSFPNLNNDSKCDKSQDRRKMEAPTITDQQTCSITVGGSIRRMWVCR